MNQISLKLFAERAREEKELINLDIAVLTHNQKVSPPKRKLFKIVFDLLQMINNFSFYQFQVDGTWRCWMKLQPCDKFRLTDPSQNDHEVPRDQFSHIRLNHPETWCWDPECSIPSRVMGRCDTDYWKGPNSNINRWLIWMTIKWLL